jgi:hypothetical protein
MIEMSLIVAINLKETTLISWWKKIATNFSDFNKDQSLPPSHISSPPRFQDTPRTTDSIGFLTCWKRLNVCGTSDWCLDHSSKNFLWRLLIFGQPREIRQNNKSSAKDLEIITTSSHFWLGMLRVHICNDGSKQTTMVSRCWYIRWRILDGWGWWELSSKSSFLLFPHRLTQRDSAPRDYVHPKRAWKYL